VVDVATAFILISAIITIGFAAALGFQRFKIPDIVILLLVGLLIGPVFHVLGADVLTSMRDLNPFFGTLVLVILLVEGGMALDYRVVLKQAAPALGYTLLAFALTMATIAGAAAYLGWQPLPALLLGAILGGNSSTVIMSLVRQLKMSDAGRTVLSLESSLNDALTIIVSLALIQVIVEGGGLDIGFFARDFFGSFTISALFATVAAVVWIIVLHWLRAPKYNYLLTLAAVLVLYVATEGAQSSGAFAALVFGIILGNSHALEPLLKVKTAANFRENLHASQAEITFFVRTFFFVFMGLILDLSGFTAPVVILATAAILVKALARYVSAVGVAAVVPRLRGDRLFLAVMLPNGLAAAAMAAYPAARGLTSPSPELFQGVAFLVILLSNVFASGAVFCLEWSRPKIPPGVEPTVAPPPDSAPRDKSTIAD
jgi:cell volume regulation protein A